MKRFIILTNTIRKMGGGQMYAANKLAYYEQLGWVPDIFFYEEGSSNIRFLNRFSENLIPELSKQFISCNNNYRNGIAAKILNKYGENDEFLFECHIPNLAYWGEYLAKKVNGKNTVFLIEESLPKFTNGEISFYEFKYERKELLNTSAKAFRLIFQKKYEAQKFPELSFKIQPYCNNVVDYDSIKLPEETANADYTILSIGRLDKPYIKGMLNQILCFTQRYNTKTFNLVIIGGDDKKIMNDYIKNLFMNAENVTLFLLGYLFPIPIDWIKLSDVSIASSNSILVSANEGIPTIAVDTQDLQPMGVYGYTTDNLWMRNNEPQTPMVELLKMILIDKKYPKKKIECNISKDLESHLKPHLDYLKVSEASGNYFDVERMFTIRDKIGYQLKKALIRVYLRIKALLCKN